MNHLLMITGHQRRKYLAAIPGRQCDKVADSNELFRLEIDGSSDFSGVPGARTGRGSPG
jgi:hypothetical protein